MPQELLPSKGRRFAPSAMIGSKRLRRLFPGEAPAIGRDTAPVPHAHVAKPGEGSALQTLSAYTPENAGYLMLHERRRGNSMVFGREPVEET